MRFLVDESLSARLASGLTQAGHDAVHLGELQLLGAQDEAVLAAAGGSGRVLLSASLPDIEESVVAGAVVVLTSDRARIRLLPIG